MTDAWIVYACLVLGLASAAVGGVFLAFSDFVMRGLLRTAPEGGIEAMQHINRTVLRSVFLLSFLALAPLSISVAAYALLLLEGPARWLLAAGAAIYLAGSLLVTALGNVPMNERLAALNNRSTEATAYWRRYGRDWTRLNHVRTIASLGAGACFLLAAIALI